MLHLFSFEKWVFDKKVGLSDTRNTICIQYIYNIIYIYNPSGCAEMIWRIRGTQTISCSCCLFHTQWGGGCDPWAQVDMQLPHKQFNCRETKVDVLKPGLLTVKLQVLLLQSPRFCSPKTGPNKALRALLLSVSAKTRRSESLSSPSSSGYIVLLV